MYHMPLQDVGIDFTGLEYGVLWAIMNFIVVVIIEAVIMKFLLKSTWLKSLWYSFAMNLTSSILGIWLPIVLLFVPFQYFLLGFILKIVLAYLLSVIIEFVILKVNVQTANYQFGFDPMRSHR